MPCWLDDDDDNLPVVLDAILNKGAHYSSVEFFVITDKVDQILACGQMCDVLRIPGEPLHRWMDLTLLHEVMAEARAEISHVRNALSAIRQCSEQQESTEATHVWLNARLSAVGISGVQAGEDVKLSNPFLRRRFVFPLAQVTE